MRHLLPGEDSKKASRLRKQTPSRACIPGRVTYLIGPGGVRSDTPHVCARAGSGPVLAPLVSRKDARGDAATPTRQWKIVARHLLGVLPKVPKHRCRLLVCCFCCFSELLLCWSWLRLRGFPVRGGGQPAHLRILPLIGLRFRPRR
jgi:hypothetical protein